MADIWYIGENKRKKKRKRYHTIWHNRHKDVGCAGKRKGVWDRTAVEEQKTWRIVKKQKQKQQKKKTPENMRLDQKGH